MALNRIDGPDELYVGGIFALRRPAAMQDKGITHILSMIRYSLDQLGDDFPGRYAHLSVDIDDVDDEDLLVHLPRAVRFVEAALHPDGEVPYPEDAVVPERMRRRKIKTNKGNRDGRDEDRDAILPAAERLEGLHINEEEEDDGNNKPAVFIHCAMGKSRSVSAAVAYLLWKYPHRYGLPSAANSKGRRRPDKETARRAVLAALDWVRRTRPIAEPNPGFVAQLQMWVEMGMPAEDGDDAVERNGTYQRWIWEREVEESARIGKAPDWIRFEDEAEGGGTDTADEGAVELRCKKCRRVLATEPFIVSHQQAEAAAKNKQRCPHYFVEALSWMKPALETGELDGRLACPNAKCGASVGRYAWQGFKCSCGEWVCPAISLQASKVDEVTVRKPAASAAAGRLGLVQDPRTALGIRLPPGMTGHKQNL